MNKKLKEMIKANEELVKTSKQKDYQNKDGNHVHEGGFDSFKKFDEFLSDPNSILKL